jgi:fructokinase
MLVSEDDVVEHPGQVVEVKDTVGAGDSFTACLADQFVRGRSLGEISESANRFASWVVTQMGATPKIAPRQLQEILAGTQPLTHWEGAL